MVLSLDAMRAKIKKQEESQNFNQNSQSDSVIYKHWEMSEGQQSKIRFVKDADETNEFFWRDRSTRKIPFIGVKGLPQYDGKKIEVVVPAFNKSSRDACNVPADMVFENAEDPIQQIMAEEQWYTARNDDYNTYKRKISHIYSGFVREMPVDFEKNVTVERKLRRFVLADQIHKLIFSIIQDPEIEFLPIDLQHGRDFVINVTANGQWNNYTTSKWSIKETPLSQEEAAELNEKSFYNLREYLPAKPSKEHLKIMLEMFEESVAGLPYDPTRWKDYYRPYGISFSDSEGEKKSSAPTTVSAAPSSTVSHTKPVETETKTNTMSSEQLFEMIKNKSSNPGSN